MNSLFPLLSTSSSFMIMLQYYVLSITVRLHLHNTGSAGGLLGPAPPESQSNTLCCDFAASEMGLAGGNFSALLQSDVTMALYAAHH
jgi:hypothetical protein